MTGAGAGEGAAAGLFSAGAWNPGEGARKLNSPPSFLAGDLVFGAAGACGFAAIGAAGGEEATFVATTGGGEVIFLSTAGGEVTFFSTAGGEVTFATAGDCDFFAANSST